MCNVGPECWRRKKEEEGEGGEAGIYTLPVAKGKQETGVGDGF